MRSGKWCATGLCPRPIALFSYVNDLAEGVNLYMLMFVDSVKLTRKVRTEKDCRMLQDLVKLQEWTYKSLPKFNPNKCKVMKMGKGDKRSVFNYTIRGKAIAKNPKRKSSGRRHNPNIYTRFSCSSRKTDAITSQMKRSAIRQPNLHQPNTILHTLITHYLT